MSDGEPTVNSDNGWAAPHWWPDGTIALALAIGAIVVICPTIDHYGLTYDEGWYISKAIRAREWAGLLFDNPAAALSEEGIARYWSAAQRVAGGTLMQEEQPGAPKLVDGLAGYALGRLFGVAFPERAGTAIFFAVALAALYVFLAPLWGRTVAVFAAGALFLLPRIFADAHLCTLDVPVMSASFASAVLMFLAVTRRSTPLAALSGLAWGVGLGCKINAVFVPFVLGSWVLVMHRKFALRAAIALLVGGVVGFLLTWPWLWRHTWSRLVEYLMFHVKHYPVAVSYFGHVSGSQPWHYPIVMTAITTPVVTLGLGVVGLLAACRLVAGGRRSGLETRPMGQAAWRRSQCVLVLVGGLVNIGFNSLPSAPKYGGVRLFLPFFPFAASLSAIGLHALIGAAGRVPALSKGTLLTPRRLRVGLAVVALLPAVRAVGLSHPYQLSYYSVLIGGTRGAVAAGMEATYWGESYLAATNYVAARMKSTDEVWVDLPGCEWIIRQYLAPMYPDARVTSSGWPPPTAAWAIIQNKASELSPASRALMASATPVFAATTADGVPLSLVYDREGIRQARGHR